MGREMVRRGACRRAGYAIEDRKVRKRTGERRGVAIVKAILRGSVEVERMDVVAVESRNGEFPGFRHSQLCRL